MLLRQPSKRGHVPKLVVLRDGRDTALFAARHGHRVTLIERDAGAPPADPDQCFQHWNRRGIAHIRQIR